MPGSTKHQWAASNRVRDAGDTWIPPLELGAILCGSPSKQTKPKKGTTCGFPPSWDVCAQTGQKGRVLASKGMGGRMVMAGGMSNPQPCSPPGSGHLAGTSERASDRAVLTRTQGLRDGTEGPVSFMLRALHAAPGTENTPSSDKSLPCLVVFCRDPCG